MEPHAVIRVRFLTTAEGGRTSAIGPAVRGVHYGCPLFVDGQGFDCRFWPLSPDGYEPGQEYDIPIRFLWPDRAMKAVSPGARITLWEGKTIAAGCVLTMNRTPDVRLRPVTERDLQTLFEFQLDPLSNELAATYPLTWPEFESRWTANLSNPDIIARAILVGGELAGSIVCFEAEGSRMVGYWIARSHWGRGLATSALRILLDEIRTRPLVAVVATTNLASLRVLQKCGFTVTSQRHSPQTERYRECEEYVLVLTEQRMDPCDPGTGPW